ncbi:hypothetical protein Hanom_Chr12g01108621 [Helianthus anomalus]
MVARRQLQPDFLEKALMSAVLDPFGHHTSFLLVCHCQLEIQMPEAKVVKAIYDVKIEILTNEHVILV